LLSLSLKAGFILSSIYGFRFFAALQFKQAHAGNAEADLFRDAAGAMHHEIKPLRVGAKECGLSDRRRPQDPAS
jgi:hypothetical protein